MKTSNNITIPHPFPYQGSKRGIAHHILPYIPQDVSRLIEPFCGASAISIAAAANRLAPAFHLNDLNKPLIALWKEILNNPLGLVDKYEQLWNKQHPDRKAFFFKIREEFNRTYKPEHLLYLLARIVKGSVRYSTDGAFNQSADNRRSGMRPSTMRRQIFAVSALLAGKTTLSSTDFRDVLAISDVKDVVYMDPPYQGTSFTRDHRYFGGLSFEQFVDSLSMLNDRNISYIISYDGHTGDKTHGKPLPQKLSLKHLHINAGRSSQATLLGGSEETIESLYLSSALVQRLKGHKTMRQKVANKQQELSFA